MSRAAWLIVALALMPSMVGGIGVQTNDLVARRRTCAAGT